jgi:hypothetical protein
VPNILDPGVGYVVDITGITETLPHDYEFPVIEATSLFNGGLTVTATPRLTTLLSPADATIGAADAAVVSSGVGAPVPSSNLVTLTIGVARPTWNGNALKGKQLLRSSQTIGGPAGCAIYGSDATHLYLCQDANALNGGNGPLVLAGGETLQIVEPSATLTGSPPTVNFGAISCWNVSQISFVGIHFVSPGANPALAIGNASGPSIIGCVVEGLYAINTPNALFIDATNLQFSYDLEPVPGIPTRTLFSNFNLPPPYAGNGSYFYIADQLQTFDDVVFDNTCPTLTPGNFTNAQLPSNWGFQNVLFQGSRGDAIQATNGQWGLVNVEIDNAAGNAITVSGGGATFMTLTNVGGGNSIPTANAGYGVRAINGSRVLVDPITMVDPIAVTGSLGDTKSGNLAVTTWLQVGEGKAYDLPLNQPFITNATGTCIQLLDVA